MAPPPCEETRQGSSGFSGYGSASAAHPEAEASAAAHLLVQSDKVDADALFSSEEVGAVVAVLQQGPAVWRAGARTARVARTPKPEQAAGGAQALRAGVVVVQKAWRHHGQHRSLRPRRRPDPANRTASVLFSVFPPPRHLESTC